jgi:hypothetical protein
LALLKRERDKRKKYGLQFFATRVFRRRNGFKYRREEDNEDDADDDDDDDVMLSK